MFRRNDPSPVLINQAFDLVRVAPLMQAAVPIGQHPPHFQPLLRGQPMADRRRVALLVRPVADCRLAMGAQVLAEHPFGFTPPEPNPAGQLEHPLHKPVIEERIPRFYPVGHADRVAIVQEPGEDIERMIRLEPLSNRITGAIGSVFRHRWWNDPGPHQRLKPHAPTVPTQQPGGDFACRPRQRPA